MSIWSYLFRLKKRESKRRFVPLTSPNDNSGCKGNDNGIIKFIGAPSAGLSSRVVKAMSKDYEHQQLQSLKQTVITSSSMKTVLLNQDSINRNQNVFSDQLNLEGNITNQRSSGRCWIFAATNIMRLALMKKYSLTKFELSQNYVFFFDKLEKANYFLEKNIELASEPDDSRLIQTLFKFPVNDGGQWDMLVNIIEKYGVVPQSAFPETHHSSASSELNWVVTKKLREFAITLRRMMQQQGKNADEARLAKMDMMTEIYAILTTSLNEPPKTFVWEFRDSNGKFYSFKNLTPQSFYNDHIKDSLGSGNETGVGAMVSLVNDPRHPYYRQMTVKHLGNVYGGRAVTYLNVPIQDMKEISVEIIQSGKPVWFGCDVGQFFSSVKGVMDLDVFNFQAAFGTDVVRNMNKADRLRYGESLMTHAMVLTGVHLSESTNQAERWRVENSWGIATGQEGFEIMSDAWFSEFTYQVVVDKAELLRKNIALHGLLERVLEEPTIVLPLWDPLGSLALI